MKVTEELKSLRELDADKLSAELLVAKKKLLSESLRVQAGKLSDFSMVSKLKKRVARIMTLIRDKA